MTCRVDEANFFILNRLPLWERGLADNVDVSEQGLQLRARAYYSTAKEKSLAQFSPGFDLKDFAAGPCSLLYLLDGKSGKIWIYDHVQDRFEMIECIAGLFTSAGSLAFTPGTLFVADSASENRVFALAAINWQTRWVIGEDSDGAGQPLGLANPFLPVDLAASRDGTLYALDQNNHAILKFDRAGRLQKAFGQNHLQTVTATTLALGAAGEIFVLAEPEQKVLRLSEDGAAMVISLPVAQQPSGFKARGLGVDAQGRFYLGDSRSSQSNEEDDRFIHRFDAAGNYLGVVAGFRGQVEMLTLDDKNRLYVYSLEPAPRLILLTPEQRFAESNQSALVKGSYFSHSFDSAAQGTVWHKLALDAEWPDNTQVRVSHLADDDTGPDQLLDDVKAGTARPEMLNQLGWSQPLVNPRDALLIKAEGRYLWLRIELFGNARQTPQVRSARVDFPRRSYLRYLPAVYQQDERSRDFLERFLSVFETFFTGTERQITQVVRYFDADAVQGEFLRWLTSWFAIAADQEWDEAKLRALLKRAPELYKQRGTRAGLAAVIEIFTGSQPIIVEHFQTRQCPETPKEVMGLLRQLYGDDPYCFCVLLKPGQAPTENIRAAVRRIVAGEKPAHTCAGVKTLQSRIQLDFHSYLEVNSYLAPPSLRLDVGAALPLDTFLTEADEAGQLERRARLELDTRLT